jgi:lysophospholipase L1-like esterase
VRGFPDAGFADQVAHALAEARGDFAYRNLGVRGLRAAEVRERQLEEALRWEPELAAVCAGGNDAMARRFDADRVEEQLDALVEPLREAGADVLLFTLPDPVPINPLAKSAAVRLVTLNAAIRDIATRRGAFLVPLDAHPVASDRRLWNEDRLHANPEGHRRMAQAAAHALNLPDADTSWTDVFTDPLGRRSRASHAVWFGRYFTPWLIRRLRGRSSGDGRVAKRPTLEPLR